MIIYFSLTTNIMLCQAYILTMWFLLLVNINNTDTIAAYRQAVVSENMTVLKKLINTGNK